MVEKGIIKHIITQNIDALHSHPLSLIAEENLTELHGNVFIEYCRLCGTRYTRSYIVCQNASFRKHLTGRKCEQKGCRGELSDTLIFFKEKLNYEYLDEAHYQSIEADLSLVLGSSLSIPPASTLPFLTQTKGKSRSHKKNKKNPLTLTKTMMILLRISILILIKTIVTMMKSIDLRN